MRSWSISVGHLFEVEVRIHLTFLILPLFIYWTDYATRQQNANGARDLRTSADTCSWLAALD